MNRCRAYIIKREFMDYRNGYISKKGKRDARLVYSGDIPSRAFGRPYVEE